MKQYEDYQLTHNDRKVLEEMGYPKNDVYSIEKWYLHIIYEVGNKKMSLKNLLGRIDRKEWLSGIGRATFHATASRELLDGTPVLFVLVRNW